MLRISTTSSSRQAVLLEPIKSHLKNLDLKSIDLNAIQNGILHLSVPLKEGFYKFPGLFGKAEVQVKPNTTAWLTVSLGKDAQHESVVSSVSIKMHPAVKIKNPSTAYEAPAGCLNGFKDLFGRIFIDGIEISPTGEVLFQGIIKKAFLKEDIKKEFKPELLPKLDMRLKFLGVHKDSKHQQGLEKISIPDVLKQFESLLGEVKCSVKIRGNTPIQTEEGLSEAELSVHARGRVGKGGELEIRRDEQFENKLEFLGLAADLTGEAQVSDWVALKPKLTGRALARLPVHPTELVLDWKNRAEVPFSMGGPSNLVKAEAEFVPGKPVRISGDVLLDVDVGEVEPILIKSLQVKFKKALLHLEGHAEKQGSQNAVQGELKAEISHPNWAWKKVHAAIPGAVDFSIQTSDLEHGTVSYGIRSDKLRPFYRSLSYAMFPKNRLALTPHNTGVSEFLDPERQFVWAKESISDPHTPPIGELGSAAWRRHIETLTGAPIRKNNKIDLLIDGKNSFPERIRIIGEAKRFVCLQSLIFKDDETGRETADALIAAHQRGVDVHVIVDSLGNIDSVKELIRGNKVYKRLSENGVKLELYSNVAVQELHDILSVVDANRTFKGLLTLRDLLDPKETLSMLNMLARLGKGTLDAGFSASDKLKIRQSLRIILGNDDKAEETVKRLATVTPENPLELSEILDIYDQVSSLNHRWHEKYLIADGEKAILGGMNIADEYLMGGLDTRVMVAGHSRPAWRDTDVLVQGDGAWEAFQCFARNWETITNQALKEVREPVVLDPEQTVELQVIQSRPLQGIHHPITNLKIESIKSLQAGDKAYEATAYFAPVGALEPYMEALKMAAMRGVDVRLVTNSAKTSDAEQVNRAALISCYRQLLKAGVRIFERTGDRTMHQKAAVYGSKIGLVGSFNLDNRSASLNSESLVVVHQAEFAQKIEDMLIKDMQEDVAKELKLEDIESSEFLEELKNSAWAMLENLM